MKLSQTLKESGLGKSIKVLKIGEVIELFAEREKLCKGTGIYYLNSRYNVPAFKCMGIIVTVIKHVL